MLRGLNDYLESCGALVRPRYKPRARLLQFREQHAADAAFAAKRRAYEYRALERFLGYDSDAEVDQRRGLGMAWERWCVVWGEGNYCEYLEYTDLVDGLLLRLFLEAGRCSAFDLQDLQAIAPLLPRFTVS